MAKFVSKLTLDLIIKFTEFKYDLDKIEDCHKLLDDLRINYDNLSVLQIRSVCHNINVKYLECVGNCDMSISDLIKAARIVGVRTICGFRMHEVRKRKNDCIDEESTKIKNV